MTEEELNRLRRRVFNQQAANEWSVGYENGQGHALRWNRFWTQRKWPKRHDLDGAYQRGFNQGYDEAIGRYNPFRRFNTFPGSDTVELENA